MQRVQSVKEEMTMTIEQKKKFDNIILEYDEYINTACDEKTKQYYCECRKKILELKKLCK